MKVVIAIDSFKGSLTSIGAGNAVKEGISEVYKDSKSIIYPIADGGEGTLEVLVNGLNGEFVEANVTNPLGKQIKAKYGVVNNTVIIEMASAAGLTLINSTERNPLHTTTYGVGELINHAIKKGYRDFIIGIGGSATNDCGVGMLSALGFKFLDKNNNPVQLGAKGLKDIVKISDDNVNDELKNCIFNIACDVNNPLCGDNGCSMVFAPQKGADYETCKCMDKWISDFSALVKQKYPLSNEYIPGAGAAGGLGYAFTTFLNGNLRPGVALILEKINIEKDIKDADFVITGEGQLDGQTTMGKAPIGVASIAKKYNIPVIAFSGAVKEDAVKCNEHGIDAFFSVLQRVSSLEEAMDSENAYGNLKATTVQAFKLIKTITKTYTH